VGLDFPFVEVSRSHSNTPHSVGLLCTSDRSVAENTTWKHTTLRSEGNPHLRRDSNPQSQQTSGLRPKP